MATQADVRRIAMSLPQVEESSTDFAFSVPNKGKLKRIAWVWKERVVLKKPRVPNAAVLAVRVANLGQKDMMVSAEPAKFFTEPHYDGYPAVLVRLSAVSTSDLKVLLAEAWRCQAPAELVSGVATVRRDTASKSPQRAKSSQQAKSRKSSTARASTKTVKRTNPAKSEPPVKRAKIAEPSSAKAKSGARVRGRSSRGE